MNIEINSFLIGFFVGSFITGVILFSTAIQITTNRLNSYKEYCSKKGINSQNKS